MTIAQRNLEMAQEMKRLVESKKAIIRARLMPVPTLDEIGEIGLLEYQAQRLKEEARKEAAKDPWWRKFLRRIAK